MKTIVARKLFTPPDLAHRFLPEGPYPVDDRRFSWVAIQHGSDARVGSLNIYDVVAQTNQNFVLPGRPGFAFPTSDPNVFIAGVEREIGMFHLQTREWTVLCDGVDADCEGTIINDGLAHDDCLVFGTKDLEFKTPKAGLYLFRLRDRKLVKLAGGQTCSNGKVITTAEDGALTLLDIDTPTKTVAAYPIDLDRGTLGERRVVLDCADQPGFPDGMTIAPDGQSIFISFYNPDFIPAGETRQFQLADGSVMARFLTPDAPQATCPQICKLNGRVQLVITTAIEHMAPDRLEQSFESGSLFVADLDYQEATQCPKFPLS